MNGALWVELNDIAAAVAWLTQPPHAVRLSTAR